jgi:O-acetyl-ADP-ribose deacetylase (regulator of RNase III)
MSENTMGYAVGLARITLIRGDITEERVDAIVNAANDTLFGGGGVDGAIHRKGGPSILEECREIRRKKYLEGLPTGEAVATTAGMLPARRVIHTVGPVWNGGMRGEPELLARAYRSSLEVAREEGLRTVAFPSISTGAYGYPIDRASRTALAAVIAYLGAHSAAFDEIRFALFSVHDLEAYAAAMQDVLPGGAAEGREA